MKKIYALVFMLAIICSPAWALDYDPYHLYPNLLNDNDLNLVYSRYGNSDVGFFYQLRDITGATRRDSVAGPQWFATVHENYYHYFHYPTDTDHTGIYRRTMGGEIPEITFSTLGDIVNNFNYVLAEEPQPYNNWIDRNLINPNYYDVYPDPVESFCIVTTNGRANFTINFGNAYARHFPFWFGWGRNSSMRWWQNYTYDSINEPIRWIIDYTPYASTRSADIYVRTGSGSNIDFPLTYIYSKTEDDYAEIYDTDENLVYIISGDEIYDSSSNLIYTKTDDIIYNTAGTVAYTIEDYDYNSTTSRGQKYLCDPRSVFEDVAINLGDEYNVSINPSQETLTNPGEYLKANVTIRSENSDTYGSTLGYLTFRQRANLASGYSNYREANPIPMVIANVSDGNASENPLIFDMTIYSSSGDIAGRRKFTWNAQSSMTQNLGTFFTMTPYNSAAVNYTIETKITNRTGTRYELYPYAQYDYSSRGNSYIIPDRWEYDLTPDLYGTLPEYFMLDAHSQIAPGLVTVYDNDFPLQLGTDTSESYRLYEYADTTPKDLRLQYKRVSGMTPQSTNRNEINVQGGSVGTQGFVMQFADVTENYDNTVYELTNLMGLPPVMPSVETQGRRNTRNTTQGVSPKMTYIRSSAITPFLISEDAQNIVTLSHSVVPDYENLDENGTPASKDVYTPLNIAVQPVSIRFKISRQSSLLVNRWDSLNEAMTSSELFNRFANFAAIWVRSAATREQDTNLFTAINNKGASVASITAGDCINAFIYDNYLYLDLMVLIADAKSLNPSKTAFIEVFRDDGVPYILIGDGQVDNSWQLEFFVDSNGENPETRVSQDVIIPYDNNDYNNNVDNNDNSNNTSYNYNYGSGKSSGTCNLGFFAGTILLFAFMKRR